MNATHELHDAGQSRDDDAAIRERTEAGESGEALFFALAIDDLTRAADLFRPIHEGPRRPASTWTTPSTGSRARRSGGSSGWLVVSRPVGDP